MREKECYGIFYSFKVLEDLLKHVPFHLKTDHKNLVYINCALTGKVARWKLFMQDWNYTISWVEGQEEHQQVPDKLSRLVINLSPAKVDYHHPILSVALKEVEINDVELAVLSLQHNATRGHVGDEATVKRVKAMGVSFTDLELKVRTFIRRCSFYQLTSLIKPLIRVKKFTTGSSYPFLVLWATTYGRGRISIYFGIDMWFLTMDRALSNEIHNCRGNCTLYTPTFWTIRNSGQNSD